MKRIMIDLETYGTAPGCGIVSIGAVFFDEKRGELGDELYTVVSRASCRHYGLYEDPGTLEWWSRQSPAARAAFDEATAAAVPSVLTMPDALAELNEFIKLDTGVLIYGNGADFDKPILETAYRVTNLKPAWAPFNSRCYRTLKAMHPVKLTRAGTHHNALDDAKHQALHLMAIAKEHNLELK